MFYPSSASGPFEFIHEGVGHDAHGFWRYLGVREHYRMYNECDNLLHSEYGVDGMSSAEGVALALGQSDPGVHDMQSNLLWRFHGEWWDNLDANRALFGEFSCLEDFVVASQLMQAEGVRYIAEADQRRAFHNSGTIVWQFNEPWRNVSCTNLVEYDGKPKLAYYALKNAFAPVAASLTYATIAPCAGEMQAYQVHLSSFGHPGAYRVAWRAEDERGGVLLQGEAEAHAGDNSMCVTSFALCAPVGLYFVKLSVYDGHTKIHDNAYFFSTERQTPFKRMIDIVKRRDFS
jgi:beta-mannosidase